MTASRHEASSPRRGSVSERTARLSLCEAIHRAFLAIVGGYVVSATTAAAVTLALTVSNVMPRSEAVAMTTMLAYLVYLVVALWAFAEPRLWRLWAGLGSVSVLSVAMTEALTSILLSRVGGG